LAEAEEVVTDSGHLHVAYPITLDRAALLLAQGRAAEAKEAALSALQTPIAQETAVHRGLARLAVGEAALALDQTCLAQEMVQEALHEGERVDAPELIYRGHLILARIALRLSALDTALEHYDELADTLQTLVGNLVNDQPSEFLEDKDDYYLEALLVALDTGDPSRALAYLEKSRASLVWTLSRRWDKGGIAGENDAEFEALSRRRRYMIAALATLRADSPARWGARERLKRLTRQMRDWLEALAARMQKPVTFTGGAIAAGVAERSTMLAYALAAE